MAMTFQTAVSKYLAAKRPARGTQDEYQTTLTKWNQWGGGVPIEQLERKKIREFLDWVHERATSHEGKNPGRTANKAREHLRAVMSWAWEQDLIGTLPHFPKPREQRDVAGRHYLAKAEINALYFATHLGHSVGGITYRHYAHRAPLAFEVIMTLLQPSAFTALVKGFEGECPCCRRRFEDAVSTSGRSNRSVKDRTANSDYGWPISTVEMLPSTSTIAGRLAIKRSAWFRAHDVLEHLRDPIHTKQEIHPCLSTLGWLLSQMDASRSCWTSGIPFDSDSATL